MNLVIYHDSKRANNRFAIYAEWTSPGNGKRKRLLERYANFDSCLCYIWQKRNENQELFSYEYV